MKSLIVSISRAVVLLAVCSFESRNCFAETDSESVNLRDHSMAIWKSGEGGYHSYRIPSLIATKRGTLLAFCEGRKESRSDTGEIHLLMRRSTDHGRSWSAPQIVWSDGANTCGNPCPVVDQDSGHIWLLLTHNLGQDRENDIAHGKSKGTRTCWVTHSEDDGKTWPKPFEITSTTKKQDWGWYATGPGVGIQLQVGKHRGRLVIPCDHGVRGHQRSHSHIIISDDHGKTWQLGGIVDTPSNECQIVELVDGQLMLNMRNAGDKSKNRPDFFRLIAISRDGGNSWSKGEADLSLPEPICQGSLLRIGSAAQNGKPWLIFSNPAAHTERRNLTLRLSKDDGKSWIASKVIAPNSSAYSCLAMITENFIGCLYEADGYKRIEFATISIDGLTSSNANQEKTMPTGLNWKNLPPIPDREGFAGMFVGVSNGKLIAAGGANFPDNPPWKGGIKKWHDAIYVLDRPDGEWRVAKERLPRPLAYGISCTVNDKVVCCGGGDANKNYADVFAVKYVDGKIEFETLPSLPKPCAHGAGIATGNRLYLVGGIETPLATRAMNNFWSITFSNSSSDHQWKELTTWPGSERMQPVVALLDGALYVIGGLQLAPDYEKKPSRVTPFLKDGYRYIFSKLANDDGRWERIADAPHAVTAAPSPTLLLNKTSFAILGGSNHLLDQMPQDNHPGFSRHIVRFDAEINRWNVMGEMPDDTSRVTATSTIWHGGYVVVNGERSPGKRSPSVFRVELNRETK